MKMIRNFTSVWVKLSVLTLSILLMPLTVKAQTPLNPPVLASHIPMHTSPGLKLASGELPEGSLRDLLSSLFTEADVPFVIGPNVEGNVSLGKLSLTREETIALLLLSSPQKLKWSVEARGVHVISLVASPNPSVASVSSQKGGVSFPNAYEAMLYDLQSEVLALKKQKQSLLSKGYSNGHPEIKSLNKAIIFAQNNLRVHTIGKEIADLNTQAENLVNTMESSLLGPENPEYITMKKAIDRRKQKISMLQKEKSLLENDSKIARK
jgi:hypothetical protein